MAVIVLAVPTQADPAGCQSTIARQFAKLKKIHLRAHIKCLRLENLARLPGPCPDAAALVKIQKVADRVAASVEKACTAADLGALGYTNCAFESATMGIEGTCAGLPVTTPAELAACIRCWKGAQLSEFIAILFASHAEEVCGGVLDPNSEVCSPLDCTSPLPDQRNLGDSGENDCQVGIAKAGFKYMVKREKILEKCALTGATQAACLATLQVQADLQKAEQVKDSLIMRKCGNRDPAPSTPFCCRTGSGNQCTVVADRDACVAMSGEVQEDKTCDAGSCSPTAGGGKKVTWWGTCPETCAPLATLQDLIDCVDDSGNEIIDHLLCFQFRGNAGADWPCPAGSPSGAFLERLDP
jgi:hypothetical protein